MNLTTVRIALRGAGAAFDYFRKLDDEKQRAMYDAVVDAIKNDEVHSVSDLANLPDIADSRELSKLYDAARSEAGAVTRASHDRLDRRRAAFAAAALQRKARRDALKEELKNIPVVKKAEEAKKKKDRRKRATGVAAAVAGLAALGGAAWALYTFVLTDKLKDRPDTPAADAQRTGTGTGTGTSTLVYSTSTEDDLARREGSAGPLAEEPAQRDEELLSSIDEQLSTLSTMDTLDEDQRGPSA